MNKHEEKWLANYRSFKEYVIANAKIPDKNVKSITGTNLFGWFVNQRHSFKTCSLDSNKVLLLNKITDNILEKSISDVNLDLYLSCKQVEYDKYNPEMVYLYRQGMLDKSLARYCVNTKSFTLSEIVESMVKSHKNSEELLYKYVSSICEIPEYGYVRLFCSLLNTDITGSVYNGDIVPVYLKDKYKFMDFITLCLKDFKNDFNTAVEMLKLPNKDLAIIDMFFGLSSGIACSKKAVGDKYGLSGERVRQILSHQLFRLSRIIHYDNNGKCLFDKLYLDCDERCTFNIESEEALMHPYVTNFEEFGVLSTMVINVLKRIKVNNFKELHEFLVSVYDGVSEDYIQGLTKIRYLGRTKAKELYDLSIQLGIKEKVFFK